MLYGALASKEANQDPIDIAFLAAATQAHLPLDAYEQIDFVPFDPKTRMTEATITKDGEKFFVGKGSFDTICAACNVPEEEAKAMLKLAEELSAKGLRVIAVAKGTNQKQTRVCRSCRNS